MRKSIDLNCDLGEGADDAAIMPWISSANIACGGHAGDEQTMTHAVRLALRHGVAIGAHPGFEDRSTFGRVARDLSTDAITELVARQIGALATIVAREGGTLAHVKPHGALYNMACADRAIADAFVAGLPASHRSLLVFALPGSRLIESASARGFTGIGEFFADRSYECDGTLTPRIESGAVLHDAATIAARAARFVTTGTLIARDGTTLSLDAQTICVHGDSPDALANVRHIVKELRSAGIVIRRFEPKN